MTQPDPGSTGLATKDEFAGLKVLSVELVPDGRGGALVTLERAPQRDGPDRWAIRRGGNALGRDGEFEYEPLPSSRTEKFYRKYRFATVEEALKIWRKHLRLFPGDYSAYQVAGG
jgi:hypothetical protein